MMGLPAGARIWIVAGVTDMRRGFVGLVGTVQTALEENPFSGHVWFVKIRSASKELTFRQNTRDIHLHVQALFFGHSSSGFPCAP